jgi:PAS domain S-box-containing protein
MVFALLVLATLAVVPFVAERSVDLALDRTRTLLEPAGRLAGELAASQAAEMLAVQTFLLSGDTGDRVTWRGARDRSRTVLDSLTQVVNPLGPDTRLRAFDVADATLQWQLLAEPVVEERLSRTEAMQSLDQRRAAFFRLQEATLALQDAIDAERTRTSLQVSRTLERQSGLTAVLAGLAVLAALGLVGVAVRLRRLAREGESRRLQTERARAEADAVLQATADGVFGVDRRGRCTFANGVGARMLGMDAGSLWGQPLEPLIPVPGSRHPLARALGEGESGHVQEVALSRAVDGPLVAALTVDPVEGQSGSLAAVLTLTDITRLTEAADALEKAVALREQVLAVVSHDLRNPVATVQSASQLLSELELSADQRSEQLSIIHRASRRADRMIRDLLDSVAVERGGLSITPVEMDAGELPAEVTDSMAAVARRRRVGVRAEPARGDLMIQGDRDRLLQALENLVGNATRYTPPEGTVIVRAVDRGDAVHLEVDDEGPGVLPETAAGLFDPFVRHDGDDPRSAGLGLAIVRGVAEGHGGRAEVDRTPEGGARFRIVLPRTAVPADPEPLTDG